MNKNTAAKCIQQAWNKYILIKNQYISSEFQTKEWRTEQTWYDNGKRNECELHQLEIINDITNQEINKTYIRIHLTKNELIEETKPLNLDDGFEYTENFDGIQMINDTILYYNLKFVCGRGGAQTRSLREVYHFIKAQINILNTVNNIYFINILDGDGSYKHRHKFLYLLNEYDKKNKIFIGDMQEFNIYWKSLNRNLQIE